MGTLPLQYLIQDKKNYLNFVYKKIFDLGI